MSQREQPNIKMVPQSEIEAFKVIGSLFSLTSLKSFSHLTDAKIEAQRGFYLCFSLQGLHWSGMNQT